MLTPNLVTTLLTASPHIHLGIFHTDVVLLGCQQPLPKHRAQPLAGTWFSLMLHW